MSLACPNSSDLSYIDHETHESTHRNHDAADLEVEKGAERPLWSGSASSTMTSQPHCLRLRWKGGHKALVPRTQHTGGCCSSARDCPRMNKKQRTSALYSEGAGGEK